MTDTLVGFDDVRQRFTVTGVVQGVGFRPFIHRIATELGLIGFVGNDSGAVFLEVQGAGARIDEFSRRLRAEAPPLAAISAVRVVNIDANILCDNVFRIVASQVFAGATTPIPPDVARLRRLHRRVVRPLRPSLPAPVRDVHQLRSPIHHHPRPALRPSGHHHVGVQHVRALRRRIPRPGQPAVPRAADRLPGLRAVALVRGRAASGSSDRMPRWRPPSRHWPRAPWSQSRASAAITWPVESTRKPRSPRCEHGKRGAPSRLRCWCVISTSRAGTPTSTTPKPRRSGVPPGRSCCCGVAATHHSPMPSQPAARWSG